MIQKYIHLASLSINFIFIFIFANKIGAVSDKLDDGFSVFPANYAFTIWGIIYIGQIYYVYLLFFNSKLIFDNSIEKGFKLGFLRFLNLNQKKTLYFSLVCLLNSLWLFSWSSFTIQNTPLFFYSSPFILLAICFGLFKIWINLDDSTPANLNALYLAWCAGATVTNLISAFSFNLKENTKRFMSVLISTLQVAFYIIWALVINCNNKLNKNSIAVPIVGLWTGLAIFLNVNNSKPFIYENTWLLLTCSVQIFSKLINLLI